MLFPGVSRKAFLGKQVDGGLGRIAQPRGPLCQGLAWPVNSDLPGWGDGGGGGSLAAGMSSKRLAWLSDSPPALIYGVTLGKSLGLCDPWLYHLQNGNTTEPFPLIPGRTPL